MLFTFGRPPRNTLRSFPQMLFDSNLTYMARNQIYIRHNSKIAELRVNNLNDLPE